MPMQRSPELLDLPDAALHRILELGHRRQRLSLMSTCKRLKELGDSSPTLWADVMVRGDKCRLQSLCAWLARSHKQVRRLTLTLCDYGERFDYDAPEEEEPMYDDAVLQAALVSAALVGRRLESLVLQWHGNLEVAGWVVAMPRLRRLGLTSESEGSVHELRMTRHLASLRQLDTLAIDANQLHMEAGCLPASLRTLCMTLTSDTEFLPGAVTEATQLRCLALRHASCDCPELWKLGGSLTRLELDDYDPSEQGVPLSDMTALRQLVVSDGGLVGEWALDIDPERGLSGLTQLTRLDFYGLSPTNQPAFCTSLGHLTSLRMLSLSSARLEGGCPPPSVLAKFSHLEALEMDFHSANSAIAALAALPRLRSLCLHMSPLHVPAPGPEALAELLQQLPCPQLTALHLDDRTVVANEGMFVDVRRQLARRGIAELKSVKEWRAAHTLPRCDAGLRYGWLPAHVL